MRRVSSRLACRRETVEFALAVLGVVVAGAGITIAFLLNHNLSTGDAAGQEWIAAVFWLIATAGVAAGGLALQRSLASMPPSRMRGRAGLLTAVAAASAAVTTLAWATIASPAETAGHTTSPLPTVLGHAESCLQCHAGVAGLAGAHAPSNIGCSSCHLGNPQTSDQDRAHAGLVRIPGNLADAARTCGASGCHAAILPRVERSIMTTMAGVIATDRAVFGQPSPTEAPPPHVRELGSTPVDRHLRQLCASCHLGQPKTDWGAIGESSRGGGCNACHLVYSQAASSALAAYRSAAPRHRDAPSVHPALSLEIDNGHCFGCHSRSGRIAPAYEGWHERGDSSTTLHPPASPGVTAGTRRLEDGREFVAQAPDVHHERGLDCIDCHTATEVMGAGAAVRHQRDQLRVRCEDCHAAALKSVPATAVDAESAKIAGLRGWTLSPAERVALTRSGDALVNVLVDETGRGELRGKRSGALHPLKPPRPACVSDAGHRRLSCTACHTAWVPRCTSCHTAFEPNSEAFDHLTQEWTRGAWTETSGAFAAGAPTLGVTESRAGVEAGSRIEPFAPGMVLTIDRAATGAGHTDVVFRRLYARTSPHTIRREVRSCESCHADPVALGYGEGTLRYAISAGTGRWQFAARHEAAPADGLPVDAWTGFEKRRSGMVSTREDARPLDPDEQRRILRVGACLTCHRGDSPPMRAALKDMAATLARRDPRCVVPAGLPLK